MPKWWLLISCNDVKANPRLYYGKGPSLMAVKNILVSLEKGRQFLLFFNFLYLFMPEEQAISFTLVTKQYSLKAIATGTWK